MNHANAFEAFRAQRLGVEWRCYAFFDGVKRGHAWRVLRIDSTPAHFMQCPFMHRKPIGQATPTEHCRWPGPTDSRRGPE